jgi:hypothetical protein
MKAIPQEPIFHQSVSRPKVSANRLFAPDGQVKKIRHERKG